jgi:hypothetical protein
VERVKEASPWTSVTRNDLQGATTELDALGVEFQNFPAQDARAIIEQLSVDAVSDVSPGEPFDSWSKMYVLLRYYFRVPQSERAEEVKRFGGWAGVPKNGEFVDTLWPLKERPDGSLHLNDTFGGYSGARYDALGEFDHFDRMYGPRQGARLDKAEPAATR